MHLNNLVIIPRPAVNTSRSQGLQFMPLSPLKLGSQLSSSMATNNSQILWKKSLSAFKKFKTKRQKEPKNNSINLEGQKGTSFQSGLNQLTISNQTSQNNYEQRVMIERRFKLADSYKNLSNNPENIKQAQRINPFDNIKDTNDNIVMKDINDTKKDKNNHIAQNDFQNKIQTKLQHQQIKNDGDNNSMEKMQAQRLETQMYEEEFLSKRVQQAKLYFLKQKYGGQFVNKQNGKNKYSQSQTQAQKWDYYDPCSAPFFEQGATYMYSVKQNKICKIQEGFKLQQQDACLGMIPGMRRGQSTKEKRTYNINSSSKKQTANNNNIGRNSNTKKDANSNGKSKSQGYMKVSPSGREIIDDTSENYNKSVKNVNEAKNSSNRNQPTIIKQDRTVTQNEWRIQEESLANDREFIDKDGKGRENVDGISSNDNYMTRHQLCPQIGQKTKRQYCSEMTLAQYVEREDKLDQSLTSRERQTQKSRRYKDNNKHESHYRQYEDSYNDDDPFIIIKSTNHSDRRRDFLYSHQLSVSNDSVEIRSNKREYINKGYKNDGRNNQMVRMQSNYNNVKGRMKSNTYTRSAYSQPYSHHNANRQQIMDCQVEQMNIDNENNMEDEGFGNTELQMIEFDLFKHIRGGDDQEKNELVNESKEGLEELSIFQVKDQIQKRKQLGFIYSQNKHQNIIREYKFDDINSSRQQDNMSDRVEGDDVKQEQTVKFEQQGHQNNKKQ